MRNSRTGFANEVNYKSGDIDAICMRGRSNITDGTFPNKVVEQDGRGRPWWGHPTNTKHASSF